MMTKPKLVKFAHGWSCSALGKEGNGRTPKAAYFDWLNECAFFPYA